MSNNLIPSIQTLPVELLHRIFDSLDAQTILFSFRQVCRLFKAIVGTYDRYVLDFKSISKFDFHSLCRLINPRNVVSLTLCDNDKTPGQVGLFLSLVRIRQFTRLRSLTLLGIDEFHLNIILKHVNINSLVSLSLNIQKYDRRRTKTTANLLSSAIMQSTLRKLELHIKNDRMREMSWPVNCTVQHLTINESINFDNICTTFQCFPQLQTLILRQSLIAITNDMISTSFRQLTSLTIEKLDIVIDKLESLLSLTPLLVHLKLIGSVSLLDGKRWEEFIQINLPLLDRFEFYFENWKSVDQKPADMKLIIASFQTPFWLEYKNWFVTCEYSINRLSMIYLYSTPICKSYLHYNLESQNILLSTSTKTMDNDLPTMDSVDSIHLDWSKATAAHIEQKRTTASHRLFRKATKLNLSLVANWPLDCSLQSLSTVIDLPLLVRIELNSTFFCEYNLNIFTEIATFIQRAHNVSLLIIYGQPHNVKFPRAAEIICSMVPHHVKHLQVPTINMDQIKMILERCGHLSSVQFNTRSSISPEKIMKWLSENTTNTTYRKSDGILTVWLGRNRIQLTEVRADHKRIKITNNHQDV